MRREGARAETVNAGHALERVREATGLPKVLQRWMHGTVCGGRRVRQLVRKGKEPLRLVLHYANDVAW